MSVTYFVQAENFDGEEIYPLGLVREIPTNEGSFSQVGNRTTKQCISIGCNQNQ